MIFPSPEDVHNVANIDLITPNTKGIDFIKWLEEESLDGIPNYKRILEHYRIAPDWHLNIVNTALYFYNKEGGFNARKKISTTGRAARYVGLTNETNRQFVLFLVSLTQTEEELNLYMGVSGNARYIQATISGKVRSIQVSR